MILISLPIAEVGFTRRGEGQRRSKHREGHKTISRFAPKNIQKTLLLAGSAALPKTLGPKELPSNTSGLERDICFESNAQKNQNAAYFLPFPTLPLPSSPS